MNFEIFMVDNPLIDDVKTIKTNGNLDFAQVCNIGILVSNANYIVALSDQRKMKPRRLEEIVKVTKTEEKIRICSSKLNEKGREYEELGRLDNMSAASELFWKKMIRDEIGLLAPFYLLN